VTVDPRRRFSPAAADYHRYRPSYPAALLDWLAAQTGVLPPARVADVGCGTGILTRLLAERGYDVVGIDPNEEMLAYARQAGGARYESGEAEATGLPEGSVDLVTAAQAFHWFDAARALCEMRRILRRGGWGAATWNIRASSPFMEEYDAILHRFTEEYAGRSKEDDRAADAIRTAPGLRSLAEAELKNRQLLDLPSFLGRVRSSSYVVHGLRDPEGFDRALHVLFDRHQEDGRIELPYRTLALAWQFIPPQASGEGRA
jgi:SAM-dependent methyltransferase